MYVCGPTVYDLLHVGNFRGAIFFNLVRNWFEYRGYKVKFIYNYTDVDDKIIQRAKETGVEASAVAERYVAEFEKDFNALKLRKHSHNPKVTEFMGEIISFVGELVDRKRAYQVDGDVYFDVHSIPDYGKLSNKKLDDLEAGVRIEVDERKRNPADFALWKSSKEGEPSWPSPWGAGRPGWHIECSAMARSLLGDTIDIHGGGLDLVFPHHENEVAQSEGATGKPFVRYWMHNNMLNFGSQKMSKSLGNVRTARAFMEEFHPEILKYLMLSAHYRSVLDFSPSQIEHVVSGLARIYSSLALAKRVVESGIQGSEKSMDSFAALLLSMRQKVEASLDEDFNTAEALGGLYEVVRAFNNLVRTPGAVTPAKVAVAREFLAWVQWLGDLMSLFGEPPAAFLLYLDDMLLKKKNLERADVEALVQARGAARKQKDFGKADQLRAQLVEMGIAVQDTSDGSEWEVAK